jgi:hypothetical protein
MVVMGDFLCGPGKPSAADIAVVERMRSDLSMPLTKRQTKWLRVFRLIEAGQLTEVEQSQLCSCTDEHCVVHGRMPPAE